MRTFRQGREYLCGIGNYLESKVVYHKVGLWRNSAFNFGNGSYGQIELPYKKPNSSNSTVVLTAKKII